VYRLLLCTRRYETESLHTLITTRRPQILTVTLFSTKYYGVAQLETADCEGWFNGSVATVHTLSPLLSRNVTYASSTASRSLPGGGVRQTSSSSSDEQDQGCVKLSAAARQPNNYRVYTERKCRREMLRAVYSEVVNYSSVVICLLQTGNEGG